VLAAEHLLGLSGVDLSRQIVERPPEIIGHRLSRLRPLGEDREVVEAGPQRCGEIAILFEPPAALQQLLRGGLVFPEIGGAGALFDFLQFFGGLCGVKDSSAGRQRGAPDPDTCEAVRPTGMSKPELL
jgi:hypothetical protein